MKHTVTLFGDELHTHPPQYWLNYAGRFNRRANSRWDDMDRDLLQYNAVFRYENPVRNGGARYLEFDTEEDFLLFVLRWA